MDTLIRDLHPAQGYEVVWPYREVAPAPPRPALKATARVGLILDGVPVKSRALMALLTHDWQPIRTFARSLKVCQQTAGIRLRELVAAGVAEEGKAVAGTSWHYVYRRWV